MARQYAYIFLVYPERWGFLKRFGVCSVRISCRYRTVVGSQQCLNDSNLQSYQINFLIRFFFSFLEMFLATLFHLVWLPLATLHVI